MISKIWYGLMVLWIAFMVTVGVAGLSHADEVMIQVDFSFQTNEQNPDSVVNAARVIKNGVDEYLVPSEDVTATAEPGVYQALIPCITVRNGPGDFTLVAVFQNGNESPASAPFPFDVPVCTSIEILTMGTVIHTTVTTN